MSIGIYVTAPAPIPLEHSLHPVTLCLSSNEETAGTPCVKSGHRRYFFYIGTLHGVGRYVLITNIQDDNFIKDIH